MTFGNRAIFKLGYKYVFVYIDINTHEAQRDKEEPGDLTSDSREPGVRTRLHRLAQSGVSSSNFCFT